MLKQILWDKPKVEVFIDLAGRDLTSGSIINISASEIAKLDKHFIFKIKDGDIINTYTEYHIDNEDGLKIIIDLLDFENSHYVITGNTLTYDSGDGYFMDTDKTLSIENLPADAKATGDAIKAVEDEVDDVKTDLSHISDNTNLFDAETVLEDKRLDSEGRTTPTNGYYTSAFIPVVAGQYYEKNSPIADIYHRLGVYSSASETALISDQLFTENIVKIHADGKYIRICGLSTEVATAEVKLVSANDYIARKTADDILNDLSALKIRTPQIEGMTSTGESKTSSNLFSNATLVATGKYVGGINSITGKASLYDNSLLDTYIIPVDGISTYTFTNCRTAVVVSDLEYTAVGSLLTYATEIDSTDGKYILFSFSPTTYPVASYSITKPVPLYYIPNDWVISESPLKNPTDNVKGAIASDGTLSITGRTAIKDGEMIAFKGKFASFSGFTLNFFGTAVTNYIAVTDSTIEIKNNTSTPTPVSHGLTIQNEVALTIEFIEGNAKISLYSMGSMYTQTVEWSQTSGTVSQPQIVSNGTTFTEASLTTAYNCAERKLWLFGDSYVGVTSPERWCYYLKENGYLGNLLLNGSAGGTSAGSIIAFDALLKYGTPKQVIMATGMNDGSDSNGTPPSLWTTRIDAFLATCQNNGITPIFCTVPTVPTVNNEAKNAWVRSSGYRYIDFASAVGADGTGAWYSGMLSSDNVHPTTLGAKALYTQVLIDLPEVTLT